MDRFQKFMRGKHGPDILSRDLIVLSFILSILNLFLKIKWLTWISFIILIYASYRVFSKNIAVRVKENQSYMMMTYPLRLKLQKLKVKWENKKEYKYFKCAKCREEFKVPRGKGRIKITCPHCKHKMLKKS